MTEDIPREVEEIADAIKSMSIRGAGRIARAGAEALKKAALLYRGPRNPEDFQAYMERVARIIVSTRPTAVSLPNAVSYVMRAVRQGAMSYGEMVEAVVRRADEFIESSLEAVRRIADIGARRISSGETILTHCHSTAAVQVIITAHRMGKEIRVYSTETRPKFQGRITYRQLREAGVNVTQIPDSAVRSIMKRVDKVVVGADTVTSDGAVVNKVGTSQVALAAHEARVRVFVAAETYKFSPASATGIPVLIEERSPSEIVSEEWLTSHPGIRVFNPAFDVTPPEYIDAIVTEVGIIPPKAAIMVLKERFGDLESPEQLVLMAMDHDEAGVYF